LKLLMNSLPDWKLPAGTSQLSWAYVNDATVAERYDSDLAGTALFGFDLRFAEALFSSPGSLVDLGCGTGRLLIPFVRAGFQVLGIDLSPEMLRAARAKAPSVPLIQANLVQLDCLR